MPNDLESLIVFIPFVYLGLVYVAYLYTRKRFP